MDADERIHRKLEDNLSWKFLADFSMTAIYVEGYSRHSRPAICSGKSVCKIKIV